MKLSFQNLSIIAGAIALAYVINKAVKTKEAMQAMSGTQTQYSPGYSDNVTGNQAKDNITYV